MINFMIEYFNSDENASHLFHKSILKNANFEHSS